jgi:hypothetical protein
MAEQEGAGDECCAGGGARGGAAPYAASSAASSVDLDDGAASVSAAACAPPAAGLGEHMVGKPGFAPASKRGGRRAAGGPFATVYAGPERACTLEGAHCWLVICPSFDHAVRTCMAVALPLR